MYILISENDYQPSIVERRSDLLVLVSGCSGGGKSSLLTELGRRGHQVFAEPGRQIVKEQLHIGGDALPWTNPDTFVELMISRSIHQMISAACSGRLSFFNRGIVEAYCHFRRKATPIPTYIEGCVAKYRYRRTVFIAPPWPEIYRTDAERRHSIDDAVAEYEALLDCYQQLGYETVLLPKQSVMARADFVLGSLGPTHPISTQET